MASSVGVMPESSQPPRPLVAYARRGHQRRGFTLAERSRFTTDMPHTRINATVSLRQREIKQQACARSEHPGGGSPTRPTYGVASKVTVASKGS